MSFDNVDRNTNEAPPTGAKAGRSGPSPALIGFAIVVVLGMIFFFQNSHTTDIHFLFFKTKDTKIRFAIIVAIVIGILLDRLFSLWWRRRKRNQG